MQPVRTNRIVDSADFIREFGVSRETVERLTVYATLLGKWQKTINLVAPSTLGEVWHRHFADSAQVIQAAGGGQLAAGGHWLDLGSGGGFPGLVAGIMLADRAHPASAPHADQGLGPLPVKDGERSSTPLWHLTLIESDQRKCAFLREVVRETGLKAAMSVDIIADRIESRANHSRVGTVDVVSARALAAMPQLLWWAEPFFGPQTVGVFLKGKDAAAEVAKVGAGWQCELVPSVTDVEARVVVVRRGLA